MTTIRVRDETKWRLEGFKHYMGLNSLDEALTYLMNNKRVPGQLTWGYKDEKKVMKYNSDCGPAPVTVQVPKAFPVQRAFPKVGRNAPCPCGSGKKYKRCCGKV
jgi:uncharacterized protein YchJ